MKNRAVIGRVAVLAAVCGIAGSAHAVTRYVNAGLATGANNGTSWADAYQGSLGLQAALAAAVPGDQIWVAAGVYTPAGPGGARGATFQLQSGIEVYGGFAGTEAALAQRNIAGNVTILSGDLNGDDQPYPSTTGWLENSFNVVTGTGANATAILDGFTVRRGLANGSSATDTDRGGGMKFINNGATGPTIRNCVIVNNRVTFGGGAVYIRTASPTFVNVVMTDNFGGSFGGAVDAANTGTPRFLNCVFRNNQAGRAGGVELFSGMNAELVNCVFQNNVATGATGGGAMLIANSSPQIRNCTIAYNRATANLTGGGLVISGGATTIRNSVLWANQGTGAPVSIAGAANVAYSCVEGGFAGVGNIAVDPAFVNPSATGDVRLKLTSPAIDAGSNPELQALFTGTVDADGNNRYVDIVSVADTGVGGPGALPVVDMGAYETQRPACYANCDGSTIVPVLNALDFSCFLGQYVAGCP